LPLEKKDITDNIATIILAGGQGTRLFPLTEPRCKPAVSFGGRYRLIDIPLSNSLNSHLRRIFVIAQFYASGLHQHILATYQRDLISSGGIELLSPEEKPEGKIWFKGTADAVRQNLEHILKAPADHFLILSGDQLYNMNFIPMIEFGIKTDADLLIATLSVKEREAKRMGLMKIDAASKIVDFIEKPQDPEVLKTFLWEKEKGHYLGSMGIYFFKKSALVSLLKEEGDDFGKHLIPLQLKRGKAHAYIYRGYWEDIGTISSYYEANLALISPETHLNIYDENNPIYTCPHNLPSPMIKDSHIRNSLISQGAIIEGAEIDHSIIGIRGHVKKGTVIRNSLILGNHTLYPPPIHFSIGENCLIERAIIDEEVLVGNRVRLINKDNLHTYDGRGIYIRDGIIIVPSGAHLPDGFTL
jgi:glucose-1-phosphate adenylyltransferase